MCNWCRRYFWNLRRYGNGKTANSSISTTPLKFEDAPARNAFEYLKMQKLELLTYIFVASSMGLSSLKFVQWAPKDASFLNQCGFCRSRSFRVIQGRWFWYQSKARIRLPNSPSLWLWSYLAPLLGYGDLLAKNCLFLLHFYYPSLMRRPRSLCSLWSFAAKLTTRKVESWGYPPVKTAWS